MPARRTPGTHGRPPQPGGLLILDELRYLIFAQPGVQLLFHLIIQEAPVSSDCKRHSRDAFDSIDTDHLLQTLQQADRPFGQKPAGLAEQRMRMRRAGSEFKGFGSGPVRRQLSIRGQQKPSHGRIFGTKDTRPGAKLKQGFATLKAITDRAHSARHIQVRSRATGQLARASRVAAGEEMDKGGRIQVTGDEPGPRFDVFRLGFEQHLTELTSVPVIRAIVKPASRNAFDSLNFASRQTNRTATGDVAPRPHAAGMQRRPDPCTSVTRKYAKGLDPARCNGPTSQWPSRTDSIKDDGFEFCNYRHKACVR